ncbi:hypothetical protein P280DRAFT_468582, partial [Massarina eburnea CBS 473.64]
MAICFQLHTISYLHTISPINDQASLSSNLRHPSTNAIPSQTTQQASKHRHSDYFPPTHERVRVTTSPSNLISLCDLTFPAVSIEPQASRWSL